MSLCAGSASLSCCLPIHLLQTHTSFALSICYVTNIQVWILSLRRTLLAHYQLRVSEPLTRTEAKHPTCSVGKMRQSNVFQTRLCNTPTNVKMGFLQPGELSMQMKDLLHPKSAAFSILQALWRNQGKHSAHDTEQAGRSLIVNPHGTAKTWAASQKGSESFAPHVPCWISYPISDVSHLAYMQKKPPKRKQKQSRFFSIFGNEESQALTLEHECPEHLKTPPPPCVRGSPASSLCLACCRGSTSKRPT